MEGLTVDAEVAAPPHRVVTGGGVSLVVHTLAPRAPGVPAHPHRHENEYSYVPEGVIGVQVGEGVRVDLDAVESCRTSSGRATGTGLWATRVGV